MGGNVERAGVKLAVLREIESALIHIDGALRGARTGQCQCPCACLGQAPRPAQHSIFGIAISMVNDQGAAVADIACHAAGGATITQ